MIVSSSPKLTPVEYLAQFSPQASRAFQELRKAVQQSGPLDTHTCELITLGALVTARNEASFKTSRPAAAEGEGIGRSLAAGRHGHVRGDDDIHRRHRRPSLDR